MRLSGPVVAVVVIFVIALSVWMVLDLVRRTHYPVGSRMSWSVGLIVGWFVGLGWLVALVYLYLVPWRARSASSQSR